MNTPPLSPRGRFITLEGIEGAGKSSCLEAIRALLERQGVAALFTREPGGTPLGEALRELLLGHRYDGMAEESELLLLFAARAEHLARRIAPALAAGQWVISDRFSDASFAYQGGGRGVAHERIATLEQWVQQGQRPDLTLLLDLPVAQGLARAASRSSPDRFERQQVAFFERVRQRYLELAQAEPERVRVIDASQPLEQVQAQLITQLQPMLTAWKTS